MAILNRVTTDAFRDCVIGQGKVTIGTPPMGEVKLSLEDYNLSVEDGTATFTLKVKNIGNTTNYKEIKLHLYELHENNVFYPIADHEIPPTIIEPGETMEFTKIIEGIEQGKKYRISFTYYRLVTDRFSYNSLGDL